MNIKECMGFIDSFSRSGKPVTDLSRAKELMKRIGNPEKQLKFVHIAGTNGKGSTVEYISNALIFSGYKTGQFTSPFVLHYADRIRINGCEIDEVALCDIASEVREKTEGSDYSQFEITMAIALLWFVREKCDVVVLECGIGGLLDCTNVIPPPLVSVITSISLDHTAILGDTVEDIAKQKAGIIKEGSAVVLSNGQCCDTVADIVKDAAENTGAIFIPAVRSKYVGEGDIFPEFEIDGQIYKVAMAGIHQQYNAETAITVCRFLCNIGWDIPENAIKKAIETSIVNARVQIIRGEPDVIVDGAHNPEGVGALADDILAKISQKGKRIYAVLGMINSKDFTESTDIIAQYTDAVFTVDDFAPNAVSAVELADIASEYSLSEPCCSLKKAVDTAKKLALKNDGIIVVCGSLYLASKYLNEYEK